MSMLWRAFVKSTLNFILFIPSVYLFFYGKPTIRGFYCHDQSLKHPFIKSTVPSLPLYILGLIIPFATILLIESLGKRALPQEGPLVWGRFTIPSFAINHFFIFVGYLSGAVVTQLFTDITKYSVGRLRPHFFSVCNPDYSTISCGTEHEPAYIREYECLGNPDLFEDDDQLQYRIKEARISFVSGHSSFAFQFAVFMVVYLQARAGACLRTRRKLFIITLIQVALLTCATFVAISRVLDYKHHAGDVIAGGLLGALIQVLNVVFVTKLFQGNCQRYRMISRPENANSTGQRNGQNLENEDPS